MTRVLVSGGTVATAAGSFKGDVLAENGVILEMGEGLPSGGARVLDASGCVVMPGGVDVHTHFGLDLGFARVDDGFELGTRAAAMGGTTCIVEHPGFGPDGCGLMHQVLAFQREMAGRCFVDYGLHGVARSAEAGVLEGVAALAGAGCPSLKAYLTYAGRVDEAGLAAIMDAAASSPQAVLTAVHCEDHAVVSHLSSKLRKAGRTDPAAHPLSRPAYAEALAVRAACAMARATGAGLYVVHLSTAEGLRAVEEARAEGVAVIAETCPQYLLLDEALYSGPDGLGFVMAPPLRTAADREALWRGLADGAVQVAATDHCAFSLALKKRLGGDDVFACPGGAAGVQTRLPLIYTCGVEAGRLTLERFVEVCCTAPARIMGLTKKGRLEPGMDADVAVLDPSRRLVIGADILGHGVDFTPFAGMEAAGWPRHVLSRGLAAVTDAAFTGEPGWGRFVHRVLERA
ncbi:MAG: dihydropyrimidinase [Thermodesulfobacteriota bacterium]